MKNEQSKKYDVKIRIYERWNFFESIPLCCLFISYNSVPLWKMENKMVKNEKENKQTYQFQV